MALLIIALFLVALLAFLPSLWVQRVIARHSAERPDFPGTGGQFARHVLDEMNLRHVRVEATEIGDHYDPEEKVVRLAPKHLDGRSLSAVVIAAHEVGHAMQDATGYRPLKARTTLAKQAHRIQQVGSILMLGAPLVMIFSRSPHLLMMEILAGALIIGTTALMHLTTLPVEFDASYRRALPLLQVGGYLSERDLIAARRILKAAALTYVAAAARSMLDIAYWLRVLRF
ncbi:MAG: zinc metallopeptidase [Pseudomonadota bacterium]